MYPSFIYGESLKGGELTISLNDNARFNGTILYAEEYKHEGNLSIAQNALVIGFIYFEGQTNIMGTVVGNCVTKFPIYIRDTITYQNWLGSGRYELNTRTEPFLNPLLFQQANKVIQ
jgi:cytoskeletal protein CcmA (bactofilin family)